MVSYWYVRDFGHFLWNRISRKINKCVIYITHDIITHIIDILVRIHRVVYVYLTISTGHVHIIIHFYI